MSIILFGIIPGVITGIVIGVLGTFAWMIYDIDVFRPKAKIREDDRDY